MAWDATKARICDWDATWNSVALGGVDAVKPDLKLKTKMLKFGSAGDIVLDRKIIGLEDDAKVVITVREVTPLKIEKMCPWFTTTTLTTLIGLLPLPGTTLQSLAQQLVLSPTDKQTGSAGGIGGTSGNNENIKLYKTVPICSWGNLGRDGNDYDSWDVTFLVLPDLTKLAAGAVNAYGEVAADV